MNTYGVKVLNRTNDHAVVVFVAHQLEFILFPAEYRLFQEHLSGWRSLQTSAGDTTQIFLVIGESRTKATHCETWSNHHRVAKLSGSFQNFIHVVSYVASRNIGTSLQNQLLELLSVLSCPNGINICAN